jgi:hypothetical protein
MSTLSPEQWRTLAPLIDQLLEMNEQEREARISSLHTQDPALAAQLKSLMDEHSVLETKASPLPGVAAGLAGQCIGPIRIACF